MRPYVRILMILIIIGGALFMQTNTTEYYKPFETIIDQESPKKKCKRSLNPKHSIVARPSCESDDSIAYNDIPQTYPNKLRPFNESAMILSEAEASSGKLLNNRFDNTYYQLWVHDEKRDREHVEARAKNIMKSGESCIDFKHVNQCMSVCSATDSCTGFYVDKANANGGKCCMLYDPPYEPNRHYYSQMPDDMTTFARRDINELIRRYAETQGKVVFNYVRDKHGNKTYATTNIDKKECRNYCPKCILGRCPKDYRCANMTADPRYNYSCMITNNDKYDEDIGETFDNHTVPDLAHVYGLDQYAGYSSKVHEPTYTAINDPRIKESEHVVPTPAELDYAYKQFKKHRQAVPSDIDPKYTEAHTSLDPTKVIKYLSELSSHPTMMEAVSTKLKKPHKHLSVRDPRNNDLEVVVDSVQETIQEDFDPWVNRDGWDPELVSDDWRYINTRGGNNIIRM